MAMNELEWRQQNLMPLEEYLELDEDVQRDSEVIEGVLVTRNHGGGRTDRLRPSPYIRRPAFQTAAVWGTPGR